MNKNIKTFRRNKPSIILVIISLFLFALPNQVYAQLNRTEIIGAYVYNFAKHTEIKKNKNLKTYNISLITENELIINEFKKFEIEKIDNKPISLSIHKNSNIDFNNTCLIFIAEDKSEIYSEIFLKTKNQQLLLVSENYSNKREVMLNLYDTEGSKILFEINKGNLYNRKIQISDELLLMGGTEIDQVELYMKLQKQLNSAEISFKELQSNIKKINSQFNESHNKSIAQQKQIKTQLAIIDKQKNEHQKLLLKIRKHKKELGIHRNEINKQQEILIEEKNKFNFLSKNLKTSKILLENQQKELEAGIHKLSMLKKEIKIKNIEVKVQEAALGEQNNIIIKQQKINQLFTAIIILVIILALILLFNTIQRSKKNKLLKEQKEELKTKSTSIADYLEKKKMINELLKNKNEELISIIEQLKKTQEQLVQSEKMASLGVLTAGIAHEINNPINFVYTGINSLKKDFKDIEVIIDKVKKLNPNDNNLKEKIQEINKLKKEYYFDDAVEAIPQTIEDISVGADRTAEIVSGLRRFSRMDENKFRLSNIHEFLQTALLMLKNKYKDSIDIERIYDEKLPEIYCNPGKITQVFMNIISNSIDAINEKQNNRGKIIITTSIESKKVKISIKDSGGGINKETKQKIFDPFFTTKEVGKGTGLGLSISYGIIEDHKGEIRVISKEGKSTQFIITLPFK